MTPKYSVKALEEFRMGGKVWVSFRSPISAPRNYKDYLAALGGCLDVDGIIFVPKSFGWHVPATPVREGEIIETVLPD